MDIIQEAKHILIRINVMQGLSSINELYKIGDNGLTFHEFSSIIEALKMYSYIYEVKETPPINQYFLPPLALFPKGIEVIEGKRKIDFEDSIIHNIVDNSIRDSFNTTAGRDIIKDSYNNQPPKRKINWLKTVGLIITIILGALAIYKEAVKHLRGQQSQTKSSQQSTKQKYQQKAKSYPDSLRHHE